MNDTPRSGPGTAAGPLMRATVAVAGLLAVVAGLAYGVQAGRALGRLSADEAVIWSDAPSILYLSLWLLFCVSAVWTGGAMLRSALRGSRRDVVPGPALYFAGCSLSCIGVLLMMGGAVARGGLAVAVGVALLVAEYRSDTL